MGKIPNLGRRIFASTVWMTFFGGGGYILFLYTKDMGTEYNRKRMEMEKGQGDQTPGKQQMIIDTLRGKGPANLKELRKITTEKRYKIAEENTVYAVAPEETNPDKMKTNSPTNVIDTKAKD